MTRVLLLEYVTAGGLHGDPAEAELLPMGRAMRDAMMHDLLALPAQRLGRLGVVGTAAALPSAADPRLLGLRPDPGEAPLDFLARQRGHWDAVWAVAPETGGLLAQCQALVAPAVWLGSDAPTQWLCASKTRTLAALARQGLATPLEAAWVASAQRWVVKPDDGAGAVDTQVFTRLAEARQALQRRRAAGEAALLQPWVEGEAMSLSLLAREPRGPQGALSPQEPAVDWLAWNRQCLQLAPDGRLSFEGVQRLDPGGGDPRRPRLQALAAALRRALPGLRGFVGVDFVWHPQAGPVVIEVNARVTCAYVGLSQALGRNLAGEVLAQALRPVRDPLAREVLHA